MDAPAPAAASRERQRRCRRRRPVTGLSAGRSPPARPAARRRRWRDPPRWSAPGSPSSSRIRKIIEPRMAAAARSGTGRSRRRRRSAVALESADTGRFRSLEVEGGGSAGDTKARAGHQRVLVADRVGPPERLHRHPVAQRDAAQRLAPPHPVGPGSGGVVRPALAGGPDGERRGDRDRRDDEPGAGAGPRALLGIGGAEVGQPESGSGRRWW